MPYVRRHGNQIAIVHGERNKVSGSVEQRCLFTLYSKAEANAALGDSGAEDARYFEDLLAMANPQLNFNWPKLKGEIRSLLPALPDIYPLQKARIEEGLEPAIDELTRRIVATSPDYSKAAAATLKKHELELSTLAQLIDIRLSQARNQPSSVSLDEEPNGFLWRCEVEKNRMPLDIEEFTAHLYEHGNYDQLKAICMLLTRCFPEWAEGHNRLGLVALKEETPKEAVEHFREAAKQGRGYFARRIAKSDYWRDFNTRPYIRALKNLALSLNMAGQWREALAICDQLEKECGDAGSDAAYAHRAAAYLNLLEWENAAEAALTVAPVAPDEGFVAGFALFELGRHLEAIEWFLHAALNSPRTAYLLLDKKDTTPKTSEEIEDHNSGVEICHGLPQFFRMQSKHSKKFFKKLLDHKVSSDLLIEVRQRRFNHYDRSQAGARKENLTRWNEMIDVKFARKQGRKIAEDIGCDISTKLRR
jgi:tetratricopeptide (TPR) repeat protein